MQNPMRDRITFTAVATTIALLACSAEMRAQTGTVSGIVRDTANRPVRDVEIVLVATNAVVRSDSAGSFRLTGAPAGPQQLRVRRMGIMPFTTSVDVRDGADSRVDLVVVAAGVELPAVEVATRSKYQGIGLVGGSDFYERERMGQGAFFTRERIDSLHPQRLYDIVRHARGFAVVWGRDRKVRIVSRRGMQSINMPCEVAIFYDGTRVSQELLPDLSVEEVEAVEAYSGPGTTPLQFGGSTSACGAVAFWMKHH